jgi:serine phosphatase RsbU (regulator of sigma subunit)
MNTILHERQLEQYYCTLCYALFDLKRKSVTLANSGLPYPVRCSGETASQIELPGVPLGSFAGSSYDEVSFDLVAGDVYVFCTDGVFEATDFRGRDFGVDRLTQVVLDSSKLPARTIVESVFAAVADFRGEMRAKDDMTVVALRITG